MSLDEKKYIIIPLLDELRRYNPSLGSYDKSIMDTNTFDYSVKLSNGIMMLPDELVTDYERAKSAITEDRYMSAAKNFKPNTNSSQPQSAQAPQNTPPQSVITPKRAAKKSNWLIILLVIAVIGIVLWIVNNNSNTGLSILPKTPAELKQELLNKEQSNPSLYVSNQAKWRDNLLNQTVLEGTLTNSATLANFKDVVVDVTFLSKTNTDISTQRYVIYQYVPAGNNVDYKIKINAPPATGGIRMGVISATPY